MTAKTYQVVVTGQIAPGAQLDQVKEKVARLFNAPPAKLSALFAGARAVVKKGLDQAAAERYVAALREAGLVALAEPVAPVTQTTPTLAPVGVTLIDAPRVAAPMIDTSALSMAPAGGHLVEVTPPIPPEIDTRRLSAAPPGEKLVEAPVTPTPIIDIGHLSMSPAGERLIEPATVPVPDIDISRLGMAPVGSDVGELRRTAFPPPPATDHLTLDK